MIWHSICHTMSSGTASKNKNCLRIPMISYNKTENCITYGIDSIQHAPTCTTNNNWANLSQWSGERHDDAPLAWWIVLNPVGHMIIHQITQRITALLIPIDVESDIFWCSRLVDDKCDNFPCVSVKKGNSQLTEGMGGGGGTVYCQIICSLPWKVYIIFPFQPRQWYSAKCWWIFFTRFFARVASLHNQNRIHTQIHKSK